MPDIYRELTARIIEIIPPTEDNLENYNVKYGYGILITPTTPDPEEKQSYHVFKVQLGAPNKATEDPLDPEDPLNTKW